MKQLSLGFVILCLMVVQPPKANGSLLVASAGSNQILSYNASTGAFQGVFVPDAASPGTAPFFLAYGPDGNLYLAPDGGFEILRYNGTTGSPLGGFSSPAQVQAVKFGPDGNAYVTTQQDGFSSVLTFNGATGAYMGAFVPTGGGGLFNARDLVFGPDGNLYVTETPQAPGFGSASVLRYNGRTGTFMDAFVPSGSGGLNNAAGLTFGPDGSLYVADPNDRDVLRYNGSTGAFMGDFVSPGSGGLGTPYDVAFGPDGNLYVSSENTDAVLEYNGTTGAFIQDFVASGSGGLSNPYGLVFQPTPEPGSLTLLAAVCATIGGSHFLRRSRAAR